MVIVTAVDARELLAVILPTASETALLRAALARPDDRPRLWAEWRTKCGGPDKLLVQNPDGAKRILPMLAPAAEDSRLGLAPFVTTCLRTAGVREQQRARVYHEICERALRVLSSESVPFVVLKGAALAAREYANPALRHCHDCDVLVKPEDRDRAVEGLIAAGFRLVKPQLPDSEVAVTHPTGLPIVIHSQLFRSPYYATPIEQIWSRAEEREVCGVVTAKVLSPPDALLHVLGIASESSSRESLVWVCDALLILRANPELDWARFVELSIRSQVALPISIMLQYLAEQHGEPIPAEVQERLVVATKSIGVAGCEAALYGAAAATRTDVVAALFGRVRGVRQRLLLWKWRVLPSPCHMRWRYGLERQWQLPVGYLVRPFRRMAYRLRRRSSSS